MPLLELLTYVRASNIQLVATMTEPRYASRTHRAFALGARVLTTTITGLLAVGAVALASGAIATRAAERPAPPPAPLPQVATIPLTLQSSFTVERSFVGQIEPGRQVDMAFETGGTVAEVLVDEGDAVAEGDVIARLDTRTLEAERRASLASRDAVAAQLELALRTAERASGLSASGFASDQRLDEAELAVAELTARMAEIGARIATIEIALDKSVLRAPFSGEIAARTADQGQTVGTGAAVVTLLDTSAPELHVGLPPELATTLAPGDMVDAQSGDLLIEAELRQLRPDLHPITRTQTAIFELNGTNLPYGQTARVTLRQTVAEQGAWVPMGALRAGSNGTWTVMVVQDRRTEAVAVELLHSDGERAFLRGAFPPDAQLVEDGVHRFVPAQAVALTE